MIKIDADIELNVTRLRNQRKTVRNATLDTVNDLAFQGRIDLQAEMRRVFDRVTPYIQKSVWVEKARKDDATPTATVLPRDFSGKSVDPQDTLRAEVYGGERNAKGFERALQRLGVLAPGMVAVPGSAAELDAYGNMKGAFLKRLLSYFQAFTAAGFSTNSSAKTIKRLAKRSKSPSGYQRIGGVEYFISRGKGTWFGKGSWQNGQAQHLAAGIWSRSGIHGSDIKPIVMFVRKPHYRVLLRPQDVIQRTVDRGAASLFAFHLAKQYARDAR